LNQARLIIDSNRFVRVLRSKYSRSKSFCTVTNYFLGFCLAAYAYLVLVLGLAL